ncbi:MAG: hypothetical protein J7K23_01390 [Thermoproteales archaeon]|nr:hypothetical protein [Thermoproteales archaeon]
MKVTDALTYVKSKDFAKILYKIYGKYMMNQRERYIRLLERAKEIFGEEANIILSRAPGRVNLMGRHVDYMGGFVNPVATSFDVLAVLERRNDDVVRLFNIDPSYESGLFKISEELPDTEIKTLSDWDRWTTKVGEERRNMGLKYTWVDYVKGLFIYLQCMFKAKITLDGFNILIDGNIPPKKGMSSSSALVIAVALALKSIYRFNVSIGDFIDIVGYSEWYRLTRGGTADHAAIILSKKGFVSHISCLPTRANEVKYAPLPKNYLFYLIDSGIERPHTEEAFNLLRSTAASYRIGVLLIKSLFPQYADKIRLLRDFNIRNLGISLVDLYKMLKKIPERITRKQLLTIIDEKYHDELNTIFSNHKEPSEGYRLRENIVYGLSETERARVFPNFLMRGDINGILRLFEVSHDGDRVFRFDKTFNMKEWNSSYSSSDEMLNKYIEILKGEYSSEIKEKVQLHWISGGYRRSVEEIDFICDYIRNYYKEYSAAQLMGAGLGGNVLIIIRKDKVNEIFEKLSKVYNERYGIRLNFLRVVSGEGAKIIIQ